MLNTRQIANWLSSGRDDYDYGYGGGFGINNNGHPNAISENVDSLEDDEEYGSDDDEVSDLIRQV